MRNNSLLKGAIWGTLAVFLSKVLGFIYLIPFNRVIDVEGKTIFVSSYRIYAYVLLIATAGIPFATANLIAKYNSQKNYAVGFKLLRSNIIIMLSFGIFSAGVLLVLAHPLALIICDDKSNLKLVNDVAQGIRIISTALIFVPLVSVVRGFFQGYKEIQISSMSQLVEQFINSTFILAAVLLAGAGVVQSNQAVYFAIFCATIASVGSLFYLFAQYVKLRSHFNEIYQEGEALKTNTDIPTKALLHELFVVSIPYIIVVLLGQSSDFIDLLYTIRGLVAHGLSQKEAQLFLTTYSLNVTKLLTIPMTVSMGVSVALIPHLSEAYAQRDLKSIQSNILKTINGIVIVLVPLVFIMMATSKHTYNVISPGSNVEYGAFIFVLFGLYSILQTFTIVLNNIMLALSQRGRIIIFIFIATLFKVVFTLPFLYLFGIYGLVISSVINILLIMVPCLVVLKNRFHLKLKSFYTITFYAFGISSVMFIVVYPLSSLLFFKSYILNVFVTGFLYLLGLSIYAVMALKLNLVPPYLKAKLARKLRFIK